MDESGVRLPVGPQMKQNSELTNLMTIPWVGKSVARNLYDIGIHSVSDLKDKNPENLYAKSNKKSGAKQDPCLLYVFRCAVYFAKTKHPEPELLKWWNWKSIKKS